MKVKLLSWLVISSFICHAASAMENKTDPQDDSRYVSLRADAIKDNYKVNWESLDPKKTGDQQLAERLAKDLDIVLQEKIRAAYDVQIGLSNEAVNSKDAMVKESYFMGKDEKEYYSDLQNELSDEWTNFLMSGM